MEIPLEQIKHFINKLDSSPEEDRLEYQKAVFDFNAQSVRLTFIIHVQKLGKIKTGWHEKVDDHNLTYPIEIPFDWKIEICGLNRLVNLSEANPNICPVIDSYYKINFNELRRYGQTEYLLIIEKDTYISTESFIKLKVDLAPERNNTDCYQGFFTIDSDFLHKDVQFKGVICGFQIPFKGEINEILPNMVKRNLKIINQISKGIEEGNVASYTRKRVEADNSFYILTGWHRSDVNEMFYHIMQIILKDIQENWKEYFYITSDEKPIPTITTVNCNCKLDPTYYEVRFSLSLNVMVKTELTIQQGIKTFNFYYDRPKFISRLKSIVSKYFDNNRPKSKHKSEPKSDLDNGVQPFGDF